MDGVRIGMARMLLESAKLGILGGTSRVYVAYTTITAAWNGYKESGLPGALDAVNPASHMVEAGVEASEAAAAEDWEAAGASLFKAGSIGMSILATAVGVGGAITATVGSTAGSAGRAAAAAGRRSGATPVRNAHLANQAHPKTGVPFDRNGYPDFSAFRHPTIGDVRIELSGSRSTDFARANTAAGVTETPAGYTWHHHQDRGLMQLVETNVHKYTGHSGGFSTR
ncbi:HNH endonuclease [Chondromyces crocatus]|nr:HNH endonuclease [Chondromyces crocatus]